jgi:uncharacterized protein YcnI
VRIAAIAFGVLLTAPLAQAHVTVWPQESKAGAGERYTVRVPTEGKVTTTEVEMEVPAAVRVSGVLVGGGFTYDLRREGDRIVTVTWKQDVKPGEYAEFVFFAVNPKTAGPVAWKVHQRYADGTSADWTGVEGDRRPASVTRITASPNTK